MDTTRPTAVTGIMALYLEAITRAVIDSILREDLSLLEEYSVIEDQVRKVDILAALWKSLELKPNFYGIGVDLKELLLGLRRRLQEKDSDHESES